MDVSESFAYIAPKSASSSLRKKRYNFSAAFIHRKYNDGQTLKNDIAMIKLEEKVRSKDYYPVKVGRPPKEGTKVFAGGYGVLNEDGKPAKYAMSTKLVAQAFGTCKDAEADSVQRHLSSRQHVCATSVGFPDEGKTDTCYGDSGGPVFKKVKGKLIQYGITSFSTTGCASPGGTPWYVRLSTYKRKLDELARNGRSSDFRKLR